MRLSIEPHNHHTHSSSRSNASQTSYQDLTRAEPTRQGSNFSSQSLPTREPSKKAQGKRHLGYSAVNHTWQPPPYSNGVQTSFNWRSGRPMAGMLELERSRTRRERTFIGSECAVCEEPLEHKLQWERVFQFSCGHVSHEACFYEYIKEFDSQHCPTCNAPLGLDTSRGGNVLDLGRLARTNFTSRNSNTVLDKLSTIVRSVSRNNNEKEHGGRSSQNTPTPWDNQTVRERPRSRESNPVHRDSKDSRDYQPSNHYSQRHGRNASTGTGTGGGSSQGDYQESQTGGRRHDYDVQAMESDLSSPRMNLPKRPIPAPTVSVRSEYPTLSRSKQSQTLTCLITIEVPEGKWIPDADDLRPPPVPPANHQEKEVVHPRSPTVEPPNPFAESPEELEETTEDLRMRVENWHGLEFSRFGKLRLHGTLRVSRDRSSWQELECFLFAEMLICIKEKKGTVPVYAEGNPKRKLTKCTLRGSILIKKHLKQVDSSPGMPALNYYPCYH